MTPATRHKLEGIGFLIVWLLFLWPFSWLRRQRRGPWVPL